VVITTISIHSGNDSKHLAAAAFNVRQHAHDGVGIENLIVDQDAFLAGR